MTVPGYLPGTHVWRLVAHHEKPARAIEWFKNSSRIAIGWGRIGDLRRSSPDSPQEIAAMIRRQYPKLNNSHLGGPSLWRFVNDMKIGDQVIVSDGRRRRLVMRVLDDYEWSAQRSPVPPGDYSHQRKAEFVETEDADRLWKRAGASGAAGENIRWPLIRLE